jgi:hypothetical protein
MCFQSVGIIGEKGPNQAFLTPYLRPLADKLKVS